MSLLLHLVELALLALAGVCWLKRHWAYAREDYLAGAIRINGPQARSHAASAKELEEIRARRSRLARIGIAAALLCGFILMAQQFA